MPPKPLIHALLASPVSGEAIEASSFAAIDREVPNPPFPPAEWSVVRRLVHASGDVGLADAVRFSGDAVAAAVAALERGAPIVVDANMIRAGLSLDRLRRVRPEYGPSHLHCHVADPDVAAQARSTGLPRSLFAVRKARPVLDGAVVVFGNAPVGLLELNRLIVEEGVRPAVVLGFPVGFVHVVESKEELERLPVPFITLRGRRGGSPLAVAALHALSGLARARPAPETQERAPAASTAVLLMGHGSRAPGAGRDMEQVAESLRRDYRFPRVEICYMSQVGPSLDEAIAQCVDGGATRLVVVPYFLHDGVHLREDIPAMLQTLSAKWPNVKLRLGRQLGFDQALVDLVAKRILELLDDLPPAERPQ